MINSKYGRLEGTWVLDSIRIGIVHAVIKLPSTDEVNVDGRISSSFSFDLNSDSTFILTDSNKKSNVGRYKFDDGELTFKKEKTDWLTFSVDSISDNYLRLNGNYILFYNFEKDTTQLFTGDEVMIIMEKKTTELFLKNEI